MQKLRDSISAKARRPFLVWTVVAIAAWMVVPRALGISRLAFGAAFACGVAFVAALAFTERSKERHRRGARE